MCKPNLFIVGAPKAGTVTLYKILQNTNQVFFPKIKELNFFSAQELKNSTYYRDYRVESEKRYLGFYSGKSKYKYRGDGSVSYFINDNVPARIKLFNKKSKILIILRNPLKRAFSHYLMDRRMGYVDKEFYEYIANRDRYPLQYQQYIINSMYYIHIESYLKIFDRSEVKVLFIEEIEKGFVELFDFLEIDNLGKVEILRENSRKIPKNLLAKYLQKNRNVTSNLKLIIPQSVISFFNPVLYKPDDKYVMSFKEKELLESILYDTKEKVEDIVGTKINFWGEA